MDHTELLDRACEINVDGWIMQNYWTEHVKFNYEMILFLQHVCLQALVVL